MTTPYGNTYPPQEPQDNQPYGTPPQGAPQYQQQSYWQQQQPYGQQSYGQQPYGQPNPYQAMDKNDSSTGGILSTIFTAVTLGLPLLILIGTFIALAIGVLVILFAV